LLNTKPELFKLKDILLRVLLSKNMKYRFDLLFVMIFDIWYLSFLIKFQWWFRKTKQSCHNTLHHIQSTHDWTDLIERYQRDNKRCYHILLFSFIIIIIASLSIFESIYLIWRNEVLHWVFNPLWWMKTDENPVVLTPQPPGTLSNIY
jgi:hypothetical protein